jgi:hypothetical protein
MPEARVLAAILAAALTTAVMGQSGAPGTTRRDPSVSLVADTTLGRASRHGVEQLHAALRARGWAVQLAPSAEAATGDRLLVVGTTAGNGAAARLRRQAGLALPSAAESLSIRNTQLLGRPALVLCGADDRGLMYAALDVADRIGWTTDSANPFAAVRDIEESPSVVERSLSVYTMNRAYWESRFYDERYWARYLDTLAASRFNRLLIIFGYENGGFLAPSYPYFFDTPGFPGVRMVNLTPQQQQRNLASLNRLIEMAHDRGLAVGLGLWDHIYRAGVQTGGAEWVADYKDRAVPNSVQGLAAENLSEYTLASLKRLLALVPEVDSLQFRVHEESGLKREEMESFWRAVFQHVKRERPGMLLEARAKGTPDSIIEAALALGVNLRVETKFWMEQMGLPFHPTHVNPPNQRDRRHGYADLLRYPQRYQMNWRLWNGGTSRLLLWADPDYVRRYSKATLLYNSPNWDVNEPLATKMEAQHPDAPPFDLLQAQYRYYDYEFERYWHFFQIWGRLGYNPDTPAEIWQHQFQRRFGTAAAPHVEAALHRASQVLPMIVASVYPYSLFPTTRGWAERQSLGATLAQYAKNEGSDVQQFESFEEAARRIASRGSTPRRTPETTSRWFDRTADAILSSVERADAVIGDRRGNEFDSTITDLRILANLARFHARRSLAAVQYNLFGVTGNVAALDEAIAGERGAIDAWRGMVLAAGDRYAFNLAMGACSFDLCGHWRDELVKLENGFAQLQQQRLGAAAMSESGPRATGPSLTTPDSMPPEIEHEPIRTAPAHRLLRITAHVTDASGVRSVRLRYRHVTQFEDYETLDMQPISGRPGSYTAIVPAEALSPQWDFMYFIEAIDAAGNGTIWPDLAREMPYVIVKVQ